MEGNLIEDFEDSDEEIGTDFPDCNRQCAVVPS